MKKLGIVLCIVGILVCIVGSLIAILFIPLKFLGTSQGWDYIYGDAGFGKMNYEFIDAEVLMLEFILINGIGIALFFMGFLVRRKKEVTIMKKCPFCSEKIQDDAIKCKYCGSELATKQVECQKAKIPLLKSFLNTKLKRLGIYILISSIFFGSITSPLRFFLIINGIMNLFLTVIYYLLSFSGITIFTIGVIKDKDLNILRRIFYPLTIFITFFLSTAFIGVICYFTFQLFGFSV